MYEILILGGIGGLVFVFVKNKFTKYENEINGLKKKLPQEFTAEQKSNMKKFGDDFEKYVGIQYENDGYEVEYRGLNLGGMIGIYTKDLAVLNFVSKIRGYTNERSIL